MRFATLRDRAVLSYTGICHSAKRVVLAGAVSCAGAFSGPIPVQTFYVPLPEDQVQSSLSRIYSNTGSQMQSVVSVAITANNTILYYDHWEDGYENDLANPLQATTEIWGDGNDANGKPPGFVSDKLDALDVIALEDLVDLPRNPAIFKFDGRDKVGVTKAIAMTRAEWAKSPGTVLAGAVEVYPVREYGYAFESPIGEDLSATSNQMFEYVSMLVMASENGTSIDIDTDGPGAGAAVTVTLNAGEAYQINGGVMVGASLSATKPVQAHLITGDVGSRYESRWYTLYPTEQWGESYYSPVGTANDGDAAFVFVYNPNDAEITINYDTKVGPGSFTVPANGTTKYQMPRNSGAHFLSAGGEPYFALETVGANPNSNLVHDWGFSLVPENNLTPELVVGWGPSSDPTQSLQTGSPVWVTATNATTVYIDYDGDGEGPNTDANGDEYDTTVSLTNLDSVRVFDPDRDQTGMRLYTIDGTLLTAAWGQDPATAGSGNPYLDMGTTVLPFPVPSVRKTHALFNDLNGDGLANVGETIRYTVEVNNDGVVVLGGVIVLDNLPPSVTYQGGSSTINGVTIADDATGTLFPFDDSGYTIASIPPNESTTITYDAVINPGATSVVNNVSVNNGQVPLVDSNVITIFPDANQTFCSDFLFTNASFVAGNYGEGDDVYLTLTDGDQNTESTTQETVLVTVTHLDSGDTETVILEETGNDTGIFRSTTALPSSSTTGQTSQDGTIFAPAGTQLRADYTDPLYEDTCFITAAVTIDTETKVLYLTGNGGALSDGLDRSFPGGESPIDTATATSAVVAGAGGGTPGSYSVSVPVSVIGDADGNTASPWESDGETDLVLSFDTTGQVPVGAVITSMELEMSGEAIAPSYLSEIRVQMTTPSLAAQTRDFGDDYGQAGSAGTYTDLVATYTAGAGTTALGTFLATITEDFNDGDAATDQIMSSITLTVNYSIPSGGGSATYTQSLTMQDDFVIPSGAVVAATSYVEVASGSIPAVPSINVTVDNGGAEIADLGSPNATLISGNGGAVVHEVTTSSSSASTSSLSFAHNPGTANNRLLMVGVSVGATTPTGNPPTISGVTFGGQAMTLVGSRVSGSGGNGDDVIAYLYRMVSPPSGSANVVVTLSGTGSIVAGASTYSGVDQTTPLGTLAAGSGGSGAGSTVVSSVAGELVYGVLAWDEDPVITVPGDQTTRWNIQGSVEGTVSGAVSTEPGALSVTHSYTSTESNQDWAVLAVPIRPLASASIYRLDWFGSAGSGYTVANGESVSTTITNGETNSFSILYDSDTYPSRVELGTTTVIELVELAAYDAPYPSGSPVTDANNGETLYVRATVTDPFGHDDITALSLTIDDPVTGAGAPISVTNVVFASGNTKIYEYAWDTNSNEGVFDLTAVATEGLETIPVTDSAGASVVLSALDLGTPGVVEFTDASGNVLVDSYDPDDTTYLRVTDFDQAGTTGPMTVVVTSSNGDTVTVNLNETAPGSGVFTGPLPSTDTTTPNTGDTTLQAPAGATLLVSYEDPDDPSDTDTDPSFITVPGGGQAVSISKSRVSPADGTALVGEVVSYELVVTNSGTGALTTVSLSDDYPAGLSFVSATEAGFSDNGNVLSWANIGPLAENQSKTITINFTAASAGENQINSATVGGDASAGPATAVVTVNGLPSLGIAKTLTSGSPNPAFIGDQVSYEIVVTNTGPTEVTTVPLVDSHSSSLSFVSASIAPTSAGGGVVYWDDLGPLVTPGGSVTVIATFDVVGIGDPVINTASVNFGTDVNGTPVPPVSAEDRVLTTSGASIGDRIWSDLDGDGLQDSNENGISGVTVYLDENGNGARDASEPFDVTDSSGLYFLSDLGPGTYTVRVEGTTLPDGTSQTGDPDASLDNATEVTLSAGQSVTSADFGYQGGTGVILGQVRNDLDGDGDLSDLDSGLEGIIVSLYADENGSGTVDGGDTLLESTLTDASGDYAFTGLGAGDYVVTETDPSGATSTNDRNNAPLAAAGTDNEIAVALLDTATSSNNDFLDTNVGNNTISGAVIDDLNANTVDEGEPRIPGVTIELFVDGNNNGTYEPGFDTPFASTVTDSAGAYLFTNVPDGNYVIRETDPPGATSTNDLTGSATDNNIGVTVNSGNANSAGNDFLDTGASLAAIRGTVFNDVDKSASFSGGDARVSGVMVRLYLDGDSDGMADPGEALIGEMTTDSSGNYEFLGLPDGDYVVVESDPPNTGSVTDSDGTLINDANEIAVTLTGTDSNGNNFLDASASISGQVREDTDGDGDLGDVDAGVAGVAVSLYRDANDNGVYDVGTDVFVAVTGTDGNGSYSFNGLGDDSYLVVESDPSGATSTNDRSNDPLGLEGTDNTIAVQISGAADSVGNDFLDTNIVRTSLSGQVRNDLDGDGDLGDVDAGIGGVVISLFTDPDGNGDPSDGVLVGLTTTDGGGDYTFADLAPGNYVVEESDPSGASSTNDKDNAPLLSAGVDNRIAVTLAGTPSVENDFLDTTVTTAGISGTVYLDTSEDNAITGADLLLSGVEVQLYADTNSNGLQDTGEALLATTYTDGIGNYQFLNLVDGRYVVVEVDPGGAVSEFDITGSPTDNNVAVELSGVDSLGNDFLDDNAPIYNLLGQVRNDLDGDGDLGDPDRGMSGVTVDLFFDANNDGVAQLNELIRSSVTDADGEYVFTGLLDGNYLVQETDLSGTISTADSGPDNGDDNLIAAAISGADSDANDFLDRILPSGYIYDSLTGEIISGGSVSVVQDSGTPATINLIQDGSSGAYAYTVDQAGTYTISYTPPTRYIVDPDRPVDASSYDVAMGLGTIALGSSESTSSPGQLANFSSAVNPYYFTFIIEPGDDLVLNNNIPLRKLKAKNYGEFLADAGLVPGTSDGQVISDALGNGGNPDGDISSNLLEHALCEDPNSGVPRHAGFCVDLVDPVTGQIDVSFIRGEGMEDVIYTLQGTDSLGGTWVDIAMIAAGQPAATPFSVTSNGDETETVIYADLANSGAAGLTSEFGLVRLCVSLDSEPDGTPDTVILPSDSSSVVATAYTKTFGWQCTDYNAAQCASYSNPFSRKPVFSGVVDTNTGALIDVSTSSNGVDLSTLIPSAGLYYLQVTSGPFEGQRFDIAGGATDLFAITSDQDIFATSDGVESLNTSDGLPANSALDGASFQVLRHRNIDELFDKNGAFLGLASGFPNQAAKLLMYQNRVESSGFITYLLVDTGSEVKWVRSNDLGGLNDQGGVRVERLEGVYIHPMLGGLTQCSVGMVADHDLAAAFNEGYNLAGSPYPADQAPVDADPGIFLDGRNMTVAEGFVGGVTPTTSSEIYFWDGDLVIDAGATYSVGYESIMLLDGGGLERWIDANDRTITDLGDQVFLPFHRAISVKLPTGTTLKPHIYPEPGSQP